jgi:4'-phosphopantetheinyl transferase
VPAEVLVFLLRPEDLGDREASLAALPAEDQAHVARFHFAVDREQALASRTLQRRALSAAVPAVAPAAWRFAAAGPGGKPVIAAPTLDEPLAWNVANTRGLVGCAVVRGAADVGFDLEPWRADAPPELIDHCFTAAERAADPRRFVELWTIKEAYLKARGLGLDPPLRQIEVILDGAAPALRLDPALADDAAAWRLAVWAPTPSHCAAVCVRTAAPLTVTTRWL